MDFEPIWFKHIKNPQIRTILITGCGGGFDFTHSLLLLPSIISLNKKFIYISKSFTIIYSQTDFPQVYQSQTNPKCIARLISSKSTDFPDYFPEIHLANFLVDKYGQEYKNIIYGIDAHETDYKSNIDFYSQIIVKHSIDMIITIDGGSDSIMKGDEYDIATVYEDWMSLIVVSEMMDKFKTQIHYGDLITVGVGVDRFHGASDASSLRAVAELTRMGGFLGNCSIMPNSEGLKLYSDFIEYHNKRSRASSIIQSIVLASAVGQYGPGLVSEIEPVERDLSSMPASAVRLLNLKENGSDFSGCGNNRVRLKTTYIWPIISNIYGFDIKVVLKRNPNAFTLRNEETFVEYYNNRKKIPVENFPLQQTMSS